MQETDAQAVAAPPIMSELHILLPPPPTPTELETLPLEEKIEAMRHQPANQHPLGFYEKTKDWLRHESPEVRRAALRYLAQHCRQHSDAETHLKMVVDDPDTQVRATAAECLGGIFRRSRNREANAVLAAVTRNQEEEGAVRAAALAAIRRVNGY
jgi:HEAT repeat protein